MAIITVNGTSIQTAQNNAAQDDELRVKNVGTYAGFDVTKRLRIVADGSPFKVAGPNPASPNVVQVKAAGAAVVGMDVSGASALFAANLLVANVPDVILDHIVSHDGEMAYGIRVYGAGAQRARIVSPEVYGIACAIQFHRGGAGSVVSDPLIHDTDRMFVNDPTPGNDGGGEAMTFYHSTGPILVERPMFDRIYSVARGKPASYDYGWDGSHFTTFGGASGITVVGGELRNSPWVLETGLNAGDPNQSNFTMRGTKVWGRNAGQAQQVTEFGKSYYQANSGFLLRSMVGFLLQDCEFHDIDWHVLLMERSGNYATGALVDNIVARGNKVWLKTSDNRWITIGANVPVTPTLFTSENNEINEQPGGTVAFVQGKGKTSDLATFKSWAPAGATWEQGSSWGPEVTVPPVDPCAPVIAENAQLKTELAAANTARDAFEAQAIAREAERKAAVGLAASLQAKLDAIPPAAKWTLGAVENKTFTLPGLRLVRYGKNGKYNYKVLSGVVTANNATFGDPLVGTVKQADYTDLPA